MLAEDACFAGHPVAFLEPQMSGACRAGNYYALIAQSLRVCGHGNIPVLSLNLRGHEKQPGFRINARMLLAGLAAVCLGDLLMSLLLQIRPCEKNAGEAEALYEKWTSRLEQELVAQTAAIARLIPQADAAIELGEDAKLLFLRPVPEARMNGVCAGGTGAFIDQMAALFHTDAAGLDIAARSYGQIYPIAARCGVFAKTDLQSLINEGAALPDSAASVFQSVVNQTVSGLTCGRPIRGKLAFLGGPLHFLPELCHAFIRSLKLSEEEIVQPENSHLSI